MHHAFKFFTHSAVEIKIDIEPICPADNFNSTSYLHLGCREGKLESPVHR